jgi:predicted GNAT family N-acyltransferase
MRRDIRPAQDADLPAMYALRHEVFVVGQGVPADLERDADDARADQVVGLLDGVVAATGRLLPPAGAGDPATIGRMAVAEPARGQGLGAGVLALLERTAVERGWSTVDLHAQLQAVPFYERSGYTAYGATYLEAGIEHVSMRKVLS